jgi:putative ABC transport system permease protein
MYSKLAFRSIRRSFKDFSIYFVTLAFSVCVFYAFNSISEQGAVLDLNDSQDGIINLLANMIGGLSIFLAFVLGFLVVYANRYLIRRRKREFAIYLTLGMSRLQISRVVVLETALIGLLSVVAGLTFGYLFSQALLYVTAAIFEMPVSGFTFYFSAPAAVFTVVCFALMFVVTLAFNVITVSRYKLIDLLLAERKSESVTLRSLPLSIVLFIVAVGMIVASYWLLIDNGLLNISPQFGAATALVCVGTVLFFYSLSGFLLRVVQGSKRIYLSGLNMFTLRQLNSRINSAFVSISVVCMVLFLALTSMCVGFSVVSVLNENLEASTRYDATYSVWYGAGSEEPDIDGDGWSSDEVPQDPAKLTRVQKSAIAANFDINSVFAHDVKGWSNLVAGSAQVDTYNTDINMRQLFDMIGYQPTGFLSVYADPEVDYESPAIKAVPISQYNELLALLGEKPISLKDNQYLLWGNISEFDELHQAIIAHNAPLSVFKSKLALASQKVEATPASTGTSSSGTVDVAFIVPDKVIPAGTMPERSVFNVMYNGSRADIEQAFTAAVAAAYGDSWNNPQKAWPFLNGTSAEIVRNNSTLLSGVISYLAIYIGLILLVTCAAILALQQLTEAVDSAKRYALLSKIGTEQRAINGALFMQVGIYFIFPLLLALAHSVVAMSVAKDVVALMGQMNITTPLITTAALSVAVYGGYYILTALTAKSSIQSRGASSS